MWTALEMIHFIEQYQTGGRTALQLRTAVLKRNEYNPTDFVISQLNRRNVECLLAVYGDVETMRQRTEDFLYFSQYAQIPMADMFFRFLTRLDWARISEKIDIIEQEIKYHATGSDENSVTIKDD